jgi:hypothetical protein
MLSGTALTPNGDPSNYGFEAGLVMVFGSLGYRSAKRRAFYGRLERTRDKT